jgi:hypothetical protein
MTLEHLTQALGKAGAKKDGTTLVMPADAEVTLLVALEGETLTIPRATRVDVGAAPMLVADNQKGEHFVFSVERLCAVKVDRSDTARRERTGFAR